MEDDEQGKENKKDILFVQGRLRTGGLCVLRFLVLMGLGLVVRNRACSSAMNPIAKFAFLGVGFGKENGEDVFYNTFHNRQW